jgi:hypothetical protein
LIVPLATVLGLSATPGEAAGFGLLDAGDARDLIAAAARHLQNGQSPDTISVNSGGGDITIT